MLYTKEVRAFLSSLNPRHVYFGWWVVFSCFIISLITGGFVILGFTAFFEPIRNDFGWSYAQISLASSLRGVEVGLLSPLMGYLTDRWGPRRLMLLGVLVIGGGMVLLSGTSSLAMFYGGFALVAVGTSGSSATVVMAATAYWFRRRLGLATGIMASGFALGGLLVPLVVGLIDVFQWRIAIFVLGVVVWVIGLPLSFLLRHRPEQYGYKMDGEHEVLEINSEKAPIIKKVDVNISAKEALKGRLFWQLAFGSLFQFLGISAVIVHVMPYLDTVGISRSLAGLIAMMVPLASVAGRIGSGWLGDKYNKKRVASILFAITGIGMLFFSYVTVEAVWLLVPFVVLFGVGWGGNPTLRTAIIRQYYGIHSFATILGFIMGILAFANTIAPFLAGWVYDNWQSYRPAWLAYAALCFVGAIMIETIPPPRDQV